jgi:hypothetical protein
MIVPRNGNKKDFDMDDILAKVKSELFVAPLGSEKRQSLLFFLGELTNAPGISTLKKILDENERAKRRTRHRKELERIEAENALLRSLICA